MRVKFPSFTPMREAVLEIEQVFFIKFAFRLSFALKKLLFAALFRLFRFLPQFIPSLQRYSSIPVLTRHFTSRGQRAISCLRPS